MQVIIKNYSKKRVEIKSLTREKMIAKKHSLIFINENTVINGINYPIGIYLPRPKEKIIFSGNGTVVTIHDAQDLDIYGYFPPKIDSVNSNDKLYHSKHTLLFSNTLFRPVEGKKLKELKRLGALSRHLKAELVELFSAGSQIPPHCHGEPIAIKVFKEKFNKVFDIKTLDQNYPHPQIISVLEGSGTIYLDSDSYTIHQGDLVIYGANTVHGSRAEKSGLKFIHFGWVNEDEV
jgi:hypothetical protein